MLLPARGLNRPWGHWSRWCTLTAFAQQIGVLEACSETDSHIQASQSPPWFYIIFLLLFVHPVLFSLAFDDGCPCFYVTVPNRGTTHNSPWCRDKNSFPNHIFLITACFFRSKIPVKQNKNKINKDGQDSPIPILLFSKAKRLNGFHNYCSIGCCYKWLSWGCFSSGQEQREISKDLLFCQRVRQNGHRHTDRAKSLKRQVIISMKQILQTD